MKLKLFKNEQYDQQQEKHEAYLKSGLKLIAQKENRDNTITRTYNKVD